MRWVEEANGKIDYRMHLNLLDNGGGCLVELNLYSAKWFEHRNAASIQFIMVLVAMTNENTIYTAGWSHFEVMDGIPDK